jgi:hypothetical protein
VACTSPIFLAVAAARAHDLEADLLQRVDNPLARYDGKLARTHAESRTSIGATIGSGSAPGAGSSSK